MALLPQGVQRAPPTGASGTASGVCNTRDGALHARLNPDSRPGNVDVPAQGNNNTTAPHAGFQLYTRHGSALCRSSPGRGLDPRAHFSDAHPYPTQQTQNQPMPDTQCGSVGTERGNATDPEMAATRKAQQDDWTKQDLIQRAREIGIRDRSTTTRAELIKGALRNH